MVIVFDTFSWIEYFLDTANAGLVEEYLEKEEIITPSIVLLELSNKANKEGWDMKNILNFVKVKSKVFGVNDNFVLNFGGIYNNAKKKVRGIGIADCIILATARLHDAKVLTGDPHFKGFGEAVMLK